MDRRLIDVQELIDRLNTNDRLRSRARFSSQVYQDEPIVKTGRQLMDAQKSERAVTDQGRAAQGRATRDHAAHGRAKAAGKRTPSHGGARTLWDLNLTGASAPARANTADAGAPFARTSFETEPLPEAYRAMRSISRWQEEGGRGRWLTEAELFVRQAELMADFDDDHPYEGTFKSYFPTYNAMSDRQLRGYFTWRAAVRRGEVLEASTSFAFVYLYELLNGIGAANPQDAFEKMHAFWQARRPFTPELDRHVPTWLVDHVVYHGLDAHLLDGMPTVAFDTAIAELKTLVQGIEGAIAEAPRGRRRAPVLPLPPNSAYEQRLLAAIDALSTYRIGLSRLYKDLPDDARHVACAVFARLVEHYRRNRKNGLVESLFGVEATMSYSMFGSAVFFERAPHADAVYELNPIHSYRCERGLWTCTRMWGAREKNARLGSVMRACDRKLREALDYPHKLKPKTEPKYVDKLIDREVSEWLAWKEAHAPRVVEIDLSKLSGIRDAAAKTREALLVDEEREDGMAAVETEAAEAAGPVVEAKAADLTVEVEAAEAMRPATAPPAPEAPVTAPTPAAPTSAAGLTPAEAAYLRALIDGQPAAPPPGASEDMLVDTINEKLYDLIGDVAVEFGANGPAIIEDYIDDLRGVLS